MAPGYGMEIVTVALNRFQRIYFCVLFPVDRIYRIVDAGSCMKTSISKASLLLHHYRTVINVCPILAAKVKPPFNWEFHHASFFYQLPVDYSKATKSFHLKTR